MKEEMFEIFEDNTIIEINSNCGVDCDLVKDALERDLIPIVYI